jgi:hypothetical protein
MSQTWGAGSDDLRALVRDVIREALPASIAAAAESAPTPPPTLGPVVVEPVSLRSDADLDGFVRRLLDAATDPLTEQALRSGRIRFVLAGQSNVESGSNAVLSSSTRIAKGAVTERHIRAAAEAGGKLILGKTAVLTPLARDRARTVGLIIERES